MQFDNDSDIWLGEGANYDVLCKVLAPNTPYQPAEETLVAIKRLKARIPMSRKNDHDPTQQTRLKSMLREMIVMRVLREHSEILDVLGTGHDTSVEHSEDEGHTQIFMPYLVVEIAVHGTLTAFLDIKLCENEDLSASHARLAHNSHPFSERQVLLNDIVKGILGLHLHDIFHTDIKPDNVLIFGSLEEGYHAKLSDFGAALIRHEASEGNEFLLGRDFGGTEPYEAPEINKEDFLGYSDATLRKADIFSFGVLLFEVIFSLKFRSSSRVPCNTPWPLEPYETDLLRELVPDQQDYYSLTEVLRTSTSRAEIRCDDMRIILDKFREEWLELGCCAKGIQDMGMGWIGSLYFRVNKAYELFSVPNLLDEEEFVRYSLVLGNCLGNANF